MEQVLHFVEKPELTDIDEVLFKFNLGDYRPVREVSIADSNKPKTLFAGFYNGNLLIVHPDLVFHFFTDEQSETERLFVTAFSGSEIAVLIENRPSNLFGYAILTDGEKIRMKDGGDEEIYHDEGEHLPEEKAMLSEEIFSENKLAEMRENEMKEEIEAIIRFEASGRVLNRLTHRYLGETVNAVDSDKVILIMYER